MILHHLFMVFLTFSAFCCYSITDFDIEYIDIHETPHFKTFHLPLNITIRENGCFEQVPLSENIVILTIKTDSGWIQIVPEKVGKSNLNVKLSIFTSNTIQNYNIYDVSVQNESLYNLMINASHFIFGNNVSNTYEIGPMFTSTSKAKIAFYQYYLNPCETTVDVSHNNYLSAKRKEPHPTPTTIKRSKILKREIELPEVCNDATCDWRTKSGVVTPVKNQNPCVSCYAFAAISIVESFFYNYMGGRTVVLSEQNLQDCLPGSGWKCTAGNGDQEKALKKIKNTGGIHAIKDYPWKGKNERCRSDIKEKPIITGREFTVRQVMNADVENIMSLLKRYGSVAASVASSCLKYHNGICKNNEAEAKVKKEAEAKAKKEGKKEGKKESKKEGEKLIIERCSGYVDHAVTIVGWDTIGGVRYWIIKNSWGPKCGDKGYYYIKIVTGPSDCKIKSQITYLDPNYKFLSQ